jgi:hypothetical protein
MNEGREVSRSECLKIYRVKGAQCVEMTEAVIMAVASDSSSCMHYRYTKHRFTQHGT